MVRYRQETVTLPSGTWIFIDRVTGKGAEAVVDLVFKLRDTKWNRIYSGKLLANLKAAPEKPFRR
jgi:hypothetical protein